MLPYPSFKTVLLVAGIALIALGYHMLSIEPDAGIDVVMSQAKKGMMAVVSGGMMIMVWLAKH